MPEWGGSPDRRNPGAQIGGVRNPKVRYEACDCGVTRTVTSIASAFISLSSADNNVILELEMLHEKKIIIGSQTSLSRYAIQLGSKFKNVDLY